MLNTKEEKINYLDELQSVKNILEKRFNVDELINQIIIKSYLEDNLLTDLLIDSEFTIDDFKLSKEKVCTEFKNYIKESLHPRYTIRSISYHKAKKKQHPTFIIYVKAKGVFTNYDVSRLEYAEYKRVFKKYTRRAIFKFTLLSVIFKVLILNYMPFLAGVNFIVFFAAGLSSIFNSIFANMFLYFNYQKKKKVSAKIFGFIFGFISFLISIILIFALSTLIS